MGQRTGSKLGREYIEAVYCHPVYLIYMQSTSCKMPGWMKYKLETRLLREVSISSDIYHLNGRKRRKTKELLDEGEREWKSWLKTQHSKTEDHDIQSHHFMANTWGEKWKQWQTLFSWDPKSLQMLTADMKLKDACSLEEKLLKNRDTTLPTKVCLIKAMVFPVVMYGCESWTIKKAECQKIDAFELWCWRRLLRVPWTARRSHQSVLKESSPEYSLKGLMQKLKLQYFGHLMWRSDSMEKTLILGKIEGRRRKGRQRMKWHHQLNGHEVEQA